ncbi:MAG TPA: DUF1269 domain-containing protein [Actinomycetota bacterium]|jgi:uncharacterized membrane protein
MSQTVICLGLYADAETADRELEGLKELGLNKHIFLHDAAVVVRGADGTVEISERTKQHGAIGGAMVGGAIGLFAALVPPIGIAAIAFGAGAGAVAGDIAGHVTGGLSKHEAEELGAFLADGEVSLVVITDEESEATVLNGMGAARERVSRTSNVSAESLHEVVEAAHGKSGDS